jgi:hypothetical protein
MLKYTFDIGMNWCLFHEDENCMECTADKCIHALPEPGEAKRIYKQINENTKKRRCGMLASDGSDECYDCGDDICLADD